MLLRENNTSVQSIQSPIPEALVEIQNSLQKHEDALNKMEQELELLAPSVKNDDNTESSTNNNDDQKTALMRVLEDKIRAIGITHGNVIDSLTEKVGRYTITNKYFQIFTFL